MTNVIQIYIMMIGLYLPSLLLYSAPSEDALAPIAKGVFDAATNGILAICPKCTSTLTNNSIEVEFKAGLRERPARDKQGNVYPRQTKRIVPDPNGFHLSYRFHSGPYSGTLKRPASPTLDTEKTPKEEDFHVATALIRI